MARKIFTVIILISILLASLACININPIDRINEVRVSYGLNTLIHNPVIDYYATYRIANMTEINHDNLKRDYYALKRQGIITGKNKVYEIIAGHTGGLNLDWAMNGWLNSPHHLGVIVDPDFTDIGYANGFINNYYIVVVIFMGKVK
jgi:uncharacterized protein YkwD